MIKLNKINTKAPRGAKKKVLNRELGALHKRLFSLQNVLYAEGKHPILIILQGIDTSGKDGTIRQVFSCINPMGCNVKAFKVPTKEELKHDFLWRIYPHLPEKGMIQIFNRSHYEDILVPSIQKTLPDQTLEGRYDFINCFEKHLQTSGIVILKFFLHISKSEQKKRIKARKRDPRKKWKYDKSDAREAKSWDIYSQLYENIIRRCSPDVPWIVVPSDQRWYRNYYIARCITEQLEKLNLKYPS